MAALLASDNAHHDGLFWVVWLAAGLTTALCVILHYETIRLLIRVLRREIIHNHRTVLIFVILMLLLAHLVEASMYAMTYQAVLAWSDGEAGELIGAYDGSLMDNLYFSLSVYSTVGFGDIRPVGPIRLLVGIEALAGLVLITWSASFTFLIMQRFFKKEFEPQDLDDLEE